MNKEFDKWWDGPEIRHSTNPYKADTAVYWSYEAWMWSAEAEREACAKVCEAFGQTLEVDVGENFAEAIRARRDE